MKKWDQIFRAFSTLEFPLFCYLLFTAESNTKKQADELLFEGFIILIFFIAPTIIGWKISSYTHQSIKVTKTLEITAIISILIKGLIVLVHLLAGLYFFFNTYDLVRANNSLGHHYYSFYILFFLFIPLTIFTFISFFKLIPENKRRSKQIVESIGE